MKSKLLQKQITFKKKMMAKIKRIKFKPFGGRVNKLKIRKIIFENFNKIHQQNLKQLGIKK